MKGRSTDWWRNSMCQGDYAATVRLILPVMIVISFVSIAIIRCIINVKPVKTFILWCLPLDIMDV